jgi:hypothetical protein
MSLLISFFAVSLYISVSDSQSAFRYYEEDYVPGINTLNYTSFLSFKIDSLFGSHVH